MSDAASRAAQPAAMASLEAQIRSRAGELASEAAPAVEAIARQKAASLSTGGASTSWSDIVGLEGGKRGLLEAIESSIAGKGTHLMLYGPPGIGKTALAKACRDRVPGGFVDVNCVQLVSKDASSKILLRGAFAQAVRDAPSLLFLDEIDVFAAASGGEVWTGGICGCGTTLQLTELLVELLAILDRLAASPCGVCVVAAVQQPWGCGEPLMCRFPQKLRLTLPKAEDRLSCLQTDLADFKGSAARGDSIFTAGGSRLLMERTEGFSICEVKAVVREVASQLLREMMKAKTFKPVPSAVFCAEIAPGSQDSVVVCCKNALTGVVVATLALQPTDQVSVVRAHLRDQLSSTCSLKLVNHRSALLRDDIIVADIDDLLACSGQHCDDMQWANCCPEDPAAVRMDLRDLRMEKVIPPPVTFSHVLAALALVHSTGSSDLHQRLEAWEAEHLHCSAVVTTT